MSKPDVIALSLPSRALALLLVAISGWLVGPSVAQASTNQDVYFEAPRDLTARGGTPATDATRDAAFKDLQSLGVKALRINLRWYDVAPSPESPTKPSFDATDPAAYDWGGYGATVDRAKQLGWKLIISPSSDVPKWATASGADTVTRPKADEFKLFTQAVAKRFGGPTVSYSIWNEPNLPKYLKPMIVGGKAVGPALYRELFIAGREGLRVGQPGAAVMFGETTNSGRSTDGRMTPLAFLRAAFCLSSKYKFDKKCGKLTLDGVSHHPYQFTLAKPLADDVNYSVLSRMPTFLDKAAKAGAINTKVRVYLTEFGVQSLPDNLLGLSYQDQVELRARVERDAYFNKRIRGFSQYLLTDDNPGKDSQGCPAYGGFETGLRRSDGTAKPSFAAFGLALDVKPSGKKKVSIWGLVRRATAATTVVVERRVSGKGSWKSWKTVKTKSNGAFTTSDSLHSKAQYRYRWTSPEGKVTSPYVRVFKGQSALKFPTVKDCT